MKHVKWAMMRTTNVEELVKFLHNKICIDNFDLFESSIDDRNGNKVEDIYVLEFDTDDTGVMLIKMIFGLKEVRGYLM